ncbi:MAG: 16S rRNA (cytosine(1402)-N(4))-methyltransferase RsmH [SAR86 cluster bacterium]|jgi:16S rRNA (cytosine1402-N4)-methyltransferase|nr:16S rRNA (cytosine(1402)-N(4))-methyltransferase RsmH [Gammaproteobacteria bacterium]MDC0484885.1 16S rRNA (cytosine(1402)-N(4))-methyltransferase RsmH [Gammaproteobacteria bacterium]MDG0965668.1 16S rRNA (cytosine(1402)-N(4))-methyltransferase RsmH [SAR86 cluster bacterium]MDG2346996.1 16S rRNA (cytosine(1402)-N(4))-methyltransferase RsmH [SAR86 cluster bacterium]|tara:strand:- start:746 stop:1639 length:894 start_codon:yes stop_codon:yes gene_type:complete
MLHVPVLLEESIDFLLNDLSGIYLDLTFGRGSHSQAILNKLSPTGSLHAVDRDLEAVSYGKDHITDSRFKISHANYSEIDVLFADQQFDGILLDLGTCSTHLDNPERGFSFQGNGPLDMRMDTSQGFSASEWINSAAEEEISSVLYKYGDEKASRKIAKAIVRFRESDRLESTQQLVQVIETVLKRVGRTHPATKTFQAIRIHVNNELNHLEMALSKISNILKINGMIVIISFQSLEDRIVKNFFKPEIYSLPKDIPLNNTIEEKFKCLKKKVKPSAEEVARNPRSRSAVMRVFTKL